MTYPEVLNYLFTQVPMFQREGGSAYKPGLDVIRALCDRLGNPQSKYPCIHVAGTNGKGSTSSLLSSVLQQKGWKVGLFTSPHIRDFRERMRVNAQMPSEEWVLHFVEKNQDLLKSIQPTFFEITTAMAFTYFAESGVDYAVIEVGMGGRLDATNVIEPILSVITNIGLDHTEFLGDTLDKIAAEKAGIIKPKVPVVVGEADAETLPVFRRMAESAQSPLIFADQDAPAADWSCGLKGLYQRKNKCAVLAAVNALNTYAGLRLSEEDIRKGFERVLICTGLEGRWQQLGEKPRILCDTGHNAHGIRYVVEQLQKERGEGKLIMVFGMVKEKDVRSVLCLLPKDASYIFTQASIPKAMPADQLRSLAQEYGLHGDCVPNVPDAIAHARRIAGEKDTIFIGGSTFVVSEIKL